MYKFVSHMMEMLSFMDDNMDYNMDANIIVDGKNIFIEILHIYI